MKHPEYEVVALYPFNNHFAMGDKLILNEVDAQSGEYYVEVKTLDSTPTSKHTTGFYEADLNLWPHIFKRLN